LLKSARKSAIVDINTFHVELELASQFHELSRVYHARGGLSYNYTANSREEWRDL